MTDTNPAARYRKRPIEIEAWQWDGIATADQRPEWLRRSNVVADHGEQTLTIHTPEGSMLATVGCWIIKGVKGELYPCQPDIFAATYEPVPQVSGDGETAAPCGKED